MHYLRYVAILILMVGVLLTSDLSAQESSADKIVGKWVSVKDKDKGTLEFTKNGKVLLKARDDDGKLIEVSGTFKVLGENQVEVTLTLLGESKKDKLTLEFDKNEISFTDSKKRTEKFRRIK